MLLRIVFLSGLISAPLYSSDRPDFVDAQNKLAYPSPLPYWPVGLLNFSDTLPTFAQWFRNFAKYNDYKKLRKAVEIEAIYYAGILAQNDLRDQTAAKIALEQLDTAKKQLKATEEQNKLMAALLALSLPKQPSTPSKTPILHSTAAAPAPSAPPAAAVLANPMQPNQMPPDHKSSQLTKG